MKRFIIIIAALSLGLSARGQGARLEAFAGCGYNRTDGFFGEAGAVLDYGLNASLSFRGGLMAESPLTVSAEVGTTVLIPLPKDHVITLEPFLISGTHVTYSIQELSLGFMAGWKWNGRVGVRLGAFTKSYIMPYYDSGESPHWLAEPFNVCYIVEGWFLPADSKFNMGLRLSNVEDFSAERFYSPSMTLKAQYALNGKYLLFLHLREHNCGIFDITSNFYEHRIRGGVIVVW